MRLWGDGFDHYGSDEGNLLDGAYATAENTTLSTAFAATGTHSVFIGESTNNSAPGGLRKVLSSSKTKMGAAARFYFPSLPAGNTSAAIFDFLSADANRSQVTCYVDSNGAFRFFKDGNYNLSGEVGTQVAASDPLIVASAWNHIEVQVYSHATAGWVRVAVNGVHRFEALNLDTLYDGTGIVSVVHTQPYYGTTAGVYPGDFYMDDYRLYDFTGNSAVDTDWCPTVDGAGVATSYIGELQGMLCLATADTAEADWGKSTGANGYALIGKATPDDSTYIYSTTDTDLSEFTLTDLPAEITYIRGVDFHSRLSKADAGAAMYKVGMKSVAATSDATEIPMTVEPTYWHAMIDVDPDSSARWTRPSFNAAWLRQIRSA